MNFNSLRVDQKMALVRTNKTWEIPESLSTDEADFWNRRTFLKSSGLLGTSLLLNQSPLSAATAGFPSATASDILSILNELLCICARLPSLTFFYSTLSSANKP